jgi:benzodiazapine receptor
MHGNMKKLIFSLVICQLAGIISRFFTTASTRTWYNTLAKPSFTPPDWMFGAIWSLLFIFMGIALFLVWTAEVPTKTKQIAMILFFIQLLLTSAWNFLFFALKSPLSGFINILVLIIFILLTMFTFYPICKKAGYLLVPYLLWIVFSAILNYSVWALNRQL